MDLYCPYCDTNVSLYTCVTDRGATPQDGDAMLCWNCRVVSVMDNGDLRKATIKERETMAPTVAIVTMQLAMKGM